MAGIRSLSGADLLKILNHFGFTTFFHRGSHVKLRRVTPDGRRQNLTIARRLRDLAVEIVLNVRVHRRHVQDQRVVLRRVAGAGRVTLGGDQGYDTRDFVARCRKLGVTPHVTQNVGRSAGSAIDRRSTPSGIWNQSAETQAGGGMLRMGEDGGDAAQAPASRHLQSRMGFHLCGCRLQSGAHA